jgi:hypothetical protein
VNTRPDRIGRIVTGVLTEALRVTGRAGISLTCAGSPEGRLLMAWCESFLQAAVRTSENPDDVPAGEWLAANPANKSALLLGRTFPSEPLLPLGDLYASQVRELTGGYNLPDEVDSLARAAGGIDALDRALQLHFEARFPADQVVEELPEAARGPFLEAVQAGRFWRERAGLIPKLGARTIGIDLLG